MHSEYTQDQILKAFRELANDEEAREELWKDICGVIAKHIDRWLNRSEWSSERAEGIIIKEKGYSRIQCPQCKSIHPFDTVFCTHCGVQIQDSWLEKIRKQNQGGPYPKKEFR